MKGLHLCYSYLVKLYICILSICELNLCALSTLRRCKCCLLLHRTLTYFIRVSITVWLTSCLTGLDLTKLKNIYIIKHKQSNWILSSQTGGQPYSDTSPDEVSECSLAATTAADFRQIFPILNGGFLIFFCLRKSPLSWRRKTAANEK